MINARTHTYQRPWNRPLFKRVLYALLTGSLWLAKAHAQYTYDPSLNKIGSDGNAAWDLVVANWALNNGDFVWPNNFNATAIFGVGGVPGTVSIADGIKVNTLMFNAVSSGRYTLTGGTLTFGGTNPTINTAGAGALITAALDGSNLALTKSGSNELQLDGPTVNLPTIKVTAGTLSTSVGGLGSFGNSTTALNVSFGAAIKTIGGLTVANPMSFNGGNGDAAIIGGATLTGPIALVSGTTGFNATSSAATITGAITGAGSFQKSGSQKITLAGTNTYSGTTTINGGTLQVGNGATAGTLGTGPVINNATITFNRSDSVTVANAISGTGTLVKSGAGTLTLTGPNNYTGITTVSAGRLQINGTFNGGSASQIIVAGGASLGGTGTYTGATTGAVTLLGGASFGPGTDTAIGTFSSNSFVWTSDNVTAAMIFNLSPTDGTSDLLALTGAFSRSATTGSYIFDFQGKALAGTTYTLVTYGSTSSTSVANLVATDLPAGYTGTFSFSGNSLKVTVVPEPNTVILALLSGASVLCLRHRRRKLPGKLAA